ncbi:MAG TPA: hypothetical protein VMT63_11545 [Bacteroidales bacterium]|nr:hypothetical protein [Bacteroidales bacterium]
MRYALLIALLAVEISVLAQTDSTERAILYNRFINKQIEESDYSKLYSLWNQRFKSDKYPDQPLDQNGEVHYTFICDFKDRDCEFLFNRTMEWLSVNYGLVPANVYSNLRDGKVIFRFNLSLPDDYTCTPTIIISIRDGRIRYEFIGISYQLYYPPDYSSGVPERTVNFKPYPLILRKPSEWNQILMLLRETKKLFSTEVQNLTDYIINYDHSNKF